MIQTDIFALCDIAGAMTIPGVSQLTIERELRSSASLRQVAARSSAPFVVLVTKAADITLGEGAVERMMQAACDTGAAMVYADHYTAKLGSFTHYERLECRAEKKHPLIDYQTGSIRDDFDFGPLLLLRGDLLRQWAQETADGPQYEYAGLYDLRLWLSRHGELLHLNETLYTVAPAVPAVPETPVVPTVPTASAASTTPAATVSPATPSAPPAPPTEQQFDYVNPANREVQIEMEQAATAHLKAIGALVDPSAYTPVDLHEQDFDVEASVIIPVYNREKTIADAVNSALSQQTTFPFNVIVVDNHSTDGTTAILSSMLRLSRNTPNGLSRNTTNGGLIHLQPDRHDLGIGGCWNMAVNDPRCGRFAVQLDSDDLYSSPTTLQRIVDAFYEQQAAMIVGSYRICDFDLQTLPPGLIAHREWTDENGPNNALRINGLGAPRAFFTPLLREFQLPNTSYGEDYAMGLRFSRQYRIGRIYDELYLCRRWGGNSDSNLSQERINANNLYKDRLRTIEIKARQGIVHSSQFTVQSSQGTVSSPLERFFDRQMRLWPEALQRYRDLRRVETRELSVGSSVFYAQYNPARIRSTGATISKEAVAARPCFLCAENRPKEQIKYSIETPEPGNNSHFSLLVNPYPILPMHFTIPTVNHQPQLIRHLYGEMQHLLNRYPQLTVFYNGPLCGASAPDHAHLQAGTTGVLPLQKEWQRLSRNMTEVTRLGDEAVLYTIDDYPCAAMVIQATKWKAGERLLQRLRRALPVPAGQMEPMMNIVAWRQGDNYLTVVFPREKHRPDCYYLAGDAQFIVSPGALDMAGLLITPRREDFERITPDIAKAILCECALSAKGLSAVVAQLKQPADLLPPTVCFKEEPIVTVGIVSAECLEFSLNGSFLAKGATVSGTQVVELAEGGLMWNGQQYQELRFVPQSGDASFSLEDVTIGIGFHWERRETQTFPGTLRLVVEAGKVAAINEVPIEQYLESVIASEMSATSSLELLKAHAVISRSWLLYQKELRAKELNSKAESNGFFSFVKKDDELLRWYDRGEHTLFDVCADDHCQRYQGITLREKGNYLSLPEEAVRQTRGQVLTFNGELCDARFSKCCGGRTEAFQYCWGDTPKPYLVSVDDPFCNTHDEHILRQVLNDYDQETIAHFHDWRVEYTQAELTELVSRKLKMDLGDITDLIPLDRGKSGRIWRLQIVGTKGSFTIGKELEIRRALSETHLLSSNFEVEKVKPLLNIRHTPFKFVLKGHGWGHGVGLCQIGAAVMGEKGYDYDDILLYYYRGAKIEKVY